MPNDRTPRPSDPKSRFSDVRAGGYHSRGVPDEEAEVRRRMRVLKLSDSNKLIRNTQPIKGGLTAESTAIGRLGEAVTGAAPTDRTLYVLARRGEQELETPVFHAGESGEEEAVAVFTDRNKGLDYLRVARWERTHELAALSPTDLHVWLGEALSEGIHLVAVDPNRQAHLSGEPQPVLLLNQQIDKSGESLYRELINFERAE